MPHHILGLPLLLTAALTLSACGAEEQEEPEETAVSEESAAPESTESQESPEDLGAMSAEEFDSGGYQMATQTMSDWLLAEGEPLPDAAQDLIFELTDQVVSDPSVEWLDEGREFAGTTSEQVPIAYPAFDSYTPNFRADDTGEHFQAIVLRIDQDTMMDFLTGLDYVVDQSDAPTTPGTLMASRDNEHFYLVALLDLTQVDRPGEINNWRQDYVSEIFQPIDVWRSSVQQA